MSQVSPRAQEPVAHRLGARDQRVNRGQLASASSRRQRDRLLGRHHDRVPARALVMHLRRRGAC
jgi:hypothetical protein